MKFHIPQFCLLEFTKFSQKNKIENKKYPVFSNNFFNIGDELAKRSFLDKLDKISSGIKQQRPRPWFFMFFFLQLLDC